MLKNSKNEINEKAMKNNKIIISLSEYDKVFGINLNDVGDDIIIMEELKKIDIDEELKIKLIENRKEVLRLINKNPKTLEEYYQLRLCKKRINYIIKKLVVKMQKENLTNKSEKNPFLPKNFKDRKILYKFLRSLELKIKEELEKNNQDLSQSTSEIEINDEENPNIDEMTFFSFLPYEDENYNKLKLEERKKKNKEKKLIYDNLYLYQKKSNKNVKIKNEVYDVLKEKSDEIKEQNEEKIISGDVNISPRGKKSKFTIKRKKFKKKNTKYQLKKIEDEKIIEINKEDEDEEEKRLEKRIAKFCNKINKLKRGKIDFSDYDDELSELMTEQIDKVNYEEDKIKELRIFNFFKNFQRNRKNEMFGKNYLRKKLAFNSPINFTFYPKIPKIRSVDSINE